MRDTGPLKLLLRGILFLPVLFLPLLVDPILELSGIEARHLAVYSQLAAQVRSGPITRIGWDLRALKLFATPRAPEYQILVLGSSRALSVSQAWFPGYSLWNASVDSGTLEDSAVLLHKALEAGHRPTTVILEVSASLGRDPQPGTSRALSPDLRPALARYGLAPRSPLSQLSDINLWWNDTTRRLLATLNDLKDARTAFVLSPDGALLAPDPLPPVMSAQAAVDFLNRLPPEQLEARSQSRPFPANAALFRRVLDDLTARGIRVIVLTVPIHPAAWDFFRKRGGYDDSWLRAELAPRNIPIVGTYSPQESHATGADFLDPFHPRPALVKRLLSDAAVISALP